MICSYILQPEAVAVKQVISGGGAIGLKEDHTHNGKDVSHSEQQDCDEDHRLILMKEREQKGRRGWRAREGGWSVNMVSSI